MPAKKGPTKPKVRRVPSDDCILVQDGEEYAIHAGEWVEFRGRPSMGFFTMYLQLQSLGDAAQAGALTAEESSALGKAAEDMGDELARHIAAWTWTDDAGEPMPLPVTGEALDHLDQTEFQWLLAQYLQASGGDRPNGSSPSTSP
jgi:hypothetical protein